MEEVGEGELVTKFGLSMKLTEGEGGISLPGLEGPFKELMELLTYPLEFRYLFDRLKVECPKGVLLHGPPGVGKTFLVRTLCEKFNGELVSVSGPEIYSPFPGESEAELRRVFREAELLASTSQRPCLLFIDEIDALAPARKDRSDSVETRVVAQLLTLMDGLPKQTARIFIIGATNRPNAIDPALRRPGRFDREVAIDVPNETVRCQILKHLTRQFQDKLGDVDFGLLGKVTIGYVSADLNRLCSEAFLIAGLEANLTSGFKLNQHHFNQALKKVSPSLQRHESVVSFCKQDWSSIAGLDQVRKELVMAVEWPLKYAEHFKRLGLRPPRGILLYGPPGCSKTSLVKVLSSTSNLPMFTLHGASVYSCYVGESEATVRSMFERARRSAPSILFIDEIDTLVGKRSFDTGGGGSNDPVQERILTMLLNEMDGVQSGGQVLVVGATNRPDSLDAALLRPGRFDRQIYVNPPTESDRYAILNLYTSRMPLADDVDLRLLAKLTHRFSGADLRNLCNEACLSQIRSLDLSKPSIQPIQMAHFNAALNVSKGTLHDIILEPYAKFHQT